MELSKENTQSLMMRPELAANKIWLVFACWLLMRDTSDFLRGSDREDLNNFSLSSWCVVIVVWLFLTVSWVCLQFVIVVFPDHTHLLFFRLALCSVAMKASS